MTSSEVRMAAETNIAPGRTAVAGEVQPSVSPDVSPLKAHAQYRVSVAEYVTFHAQGFLIVRGLVPDDDVLEMVRHSEDLMHGRIDVPGLEPPPPGASP